VYTAIVCADEPRLGHEIVSAYGKTGLPQRISVCMLSDWKFLLSIAFLKIRFSGCAMRKCSI